jgi:Family of unknown function (DUF5681)
MKSTATRGARRAKSQRRCRPTRQESTREIMEWLLTRRVSISVSGQARRVSASEAIVLQLMQKAMSGSARAWRALLKYQEFTNSRAGRSTELRIVESDYTRAIAKSSSRGPDG